MIPEYGRNFSFIKHFVEFLWGGGGSRDSSSFSRNAVSVPKLYFESHLSLIELLFSSSYFHMNLVRNWTQYKKINTFTFENNNFLLAQIFDVLKIWQNLPIVFQTLKVFMSSALTFKFMTTEILVFLELFPVMKNIYLLMSICDRLLGPKYRVFVKLSHVKLFLWVKIFNWAQTETSNSSSTVSVVQWYFENRNISVGLWPLFRQFEVENPFFI